MQSGYKQKREKQASIELTQELQKFLLKPTAAKGIRQELVELRPAQLFVRR